MPPCCPGSGQGRFPRTDAGVLGLGAPGRRRGGRAGADRHHGDQHDHHRVLHHRPDLLIGLGPAGVGRRPAGPQRDLQHEPLAVLVGQLVVDAGHRLVGAVAQPGIDHPLRDARVDADGLEGVPQRVDGKPAGLPPGRHAGGRQQLLEVLVEVLGVDPVAALRVLPAGRGREEPRPGLGQGHQEGLELGMDRHLSRVAGLGLGPLAGDDVQPVALQVDVLDPQTLEFARPHAGEGQHRVLGEPGLAGRLQDPLDLGLRRPAAGLQFSAARTSSPPRGFP